MAVDERSRHELFSQLERTLGQEAASTLMEHLPPTGWADVVTRRDLDLLRAELRADFAELRGDLFGLRADFRGELNAAITGQTRAIVFSTVGSVAAVTGIVLGLA